MDGRYELIKKYGLTHLILVAIWFQLRFSSTANLFNRFAFGRSSKMSGNTRKQKMFDIKDIAPADEAAQ
jgi:hypothetical protein